MITFVDHAGVAYLSSSSVTITRPACSVGDLLLAVVALNAGGSPGGVVMTPPTGWTLLGRTNTSATMAQATYYRVVTLTETASYTFTLSGGSYAVAAVVASYTAVTGIDTGGGQADNSVNTATAPSLTVAQEDSELFMSWSVSGSPVNGVTPVTATIRASLTAGTMVLVVGDELRGPKEATHARTLTFDAPPADTVGQMVAMIPAVVPTVPFKDNYKSKLLRGTIPPPFDAHLDEDFGKLLTIMGTEDNAIGGQFGTRDFLPDETP